MIMLNFFKVSAPANIEIFCSRTAMEGEMKWFAIF